MLLNQITGGPLSAFVNADISSFDFGWTDSELADALLDNMNNYFFVQFCRPYCEPYSFKEIFVNVMPDFVLVNFANSMVFKTCFYDEKVWELFAKVMFLRTGHALFYEIHHVSIH